MYSFTYVNSIIPFVSVQHPLSTWLDEQLTGKFFGHWFISLFSGTLSTLAEANPNNNAYIPNFI